MQSILDCLFLMKTVVELMKINKNCLQKCYFCCFKIDFNDVSYNIKMCIRTLQYGPSLLSFLRGNYTQWAVSPFLSKKNFIRIEK